MSVVLPVSVAVLVLVIVIVSAVELAPSEPLSSLVSACPVPLLLVNGSSTNCGSTSIHAVSRADITRAHEPFAARRTARRSFLRSCNTAPTHRPIAAKTWPQRLRWTTWGRQRARQPRGLQPAQVPPWTCCAVTRLGCTTKNHMPASQARAFRRISPS